MLNSSESQNQAEPEGVALDPEALPRVWAGELRSLAKEFRHQPASEQERRLRHRAGCIIIAATQEGLAGMDEFSELVDFHLSPTPQQGRECELVRCPSNLLSAVACQLSSQLGIPREGTDWPEVYAAVCEAVAAVIESPTVTRTNHRQVSIRVEGEDLVYVDEQPYRLRSQHDAQFINRLLQTRGVSVKGNSLATAIGEHPSRIYKRLPEPVQRLILKPGRGGQGYIML